VTADSPEPGEHRSGLARAADDSPLTARGLIDAVGGPLGIVESVLPPLVFVVVYQIAAIRSAPDSVDRAALIPIVVAPLVLSALFALYRLVRRQRPGGAISGAVLVAVSAALVLITGDANTNYVPGFVINIVYGLVFLVSVLVRRPLVGVVTGMLTSDTTWRQDPTLRRSATWLSLLWVLLFAIRLAVELPLYFVAQASGRAADTIALGIARIVLGLPLYSIVLVVTVLVVQALRRSRAA
jgi:intracellular septation protein A